MAWRYDDPRWVRLDQSFVLLTSALFVASVLSWRGVPVFGSEPPFRPLGSVFLSGAMLLQAVGVIFSRRRLYLFSYSLLVVSMACLWFSVTVR